MRTHAVDGLARAQAFEPNVPGARLYIRSGRRRGRGRAAYAGGVPSGVHALRGCRGAGLGS